MRTVCAHGMSTFPGVTPVQATPEGTPGPSKKALAQIPGTLGAGAHPLQPRQKPRAEAASPANTRSVSLREGRNKLLLVMQKRRRKSC